MIIRSESLVILLKLVNLHHHPYNVKAEGILNQASKILAERDFLQCFSNMLCCSWTSMSFSDNESALTISFWIKNYLSSCIPSHAAHEETVCHTAVLIRRCSFRDNFSLSLFFFFKNFLIYILLFIFPFPLLVEADKIDLLLGAFCLWMEERK